MCIILREGLISGKVRPICWYVKIFVLLQYDHQLLTASCQRDMYCKVAAYL